MVLRSSIHNISFRNFTYLIHLNHYNTLKTLVHYPIIKFVRMNFGMIYLDKNQHDPKSWNSWLKVLMSQLLLLYMSNNEASSIHIVMHSSTQMWIILTSDHYGLMQICIVISKELVFHMPLLVLSILCLFFWEFPCDSINVGPRNVKWWGWLSTEQIKSSD